MALSTAAMAQVPVPTIQQPDQQIDQILRDPVPDVAPGLVIIDIKRSEPPRQAERVRFNLMGINIDGAQSFDQAAFDEIWVSDLGTEISVAELYRYRDEIQERYRESGYPFTRVVVPPQKIVEGQPVRLQIVEAYIGRVDVLSDEDVLPSVARKACGYAARLIGRDRVRSLDGPCFEISEGATGKPFSFQKLEKVMLLINDLPGISASAVPQQGDASAPGALHLLIRITEHNRYSGSLFLNNRQADIVGPGLAAFSINANSYSPFGDSTQITVLNSFDLDASPNEFGVSEMDGDLNERTTVQISHSHYLGNRGGEVQASFLYSKTNPGDELAPLIFEGRQYRGTMRYQHPIIRGRSHSFWAGLEGAYTDAIADVSDGALRISDDRITTLAIDGTYLWQSTGAGFGRIGDYVVADMEVRQGLPLFAASEAGDENRSRGDAEVDFTIFRGLIQGRRMLPYGASANMKVAYQYSTESVLAPEEFAIGGQDFGRAYDPAEFSADRGAAVALELERPFRVPAIGPNFAVRPYGFGDYSYVVNLQDQADNITEELISAGGGLRFNFGEEQSVLSFEAAVPINQPLRRTEEQHTRFFVQLLQRF